MNRWHTFEGAPHPLGATWIAEEQAYNFALYSKHATGVVLLLYADRDVVNPVFTRRLIYPYNKTGRIWHCRVRASDAHEAKFYAYSVEGPFEPEEGHRFDSHKILLDPYARIVSFPTDFSREAASRSGSNAGRAPLGLLPSQDGAFDWGDERRPEHPHDTVIYELHVRGFTQSPTSGVPNGANGTYQGLIEKIPYLTKLGVTAVELMPVQQRDPQERNYWGYMPLGFFVAGDEFMRTQKGNNNPYNQDNETSWLDWSLLEKNRDMFRFFQGMIAFRKAHPSLCRSRFWRDDVSWYGQDAQVDQSAESHSLAFLLRGASEADKDIYVMINASDTDKTFRIQHGAANSWRRVVDTSLASPEDICEPGFEPLLDSMDYLVRARIVVALLAR